MHAPPCSKNHTEIDAPDTTQIKKRYFISTETHKIDIKCHNENLRFIKIILRLITFKFNV